MEISDQIGWIWSFVVSMLGICVLGFFFLNKRLNQLSDKINITDSFSEQLKVLNIKLSDFIERFDRMEKKLVGDIDKRGLVWHVFDNIEEIEKIKRKIGMNGDEK